MKIVLEREVHCILLGLTIRSCVGRGQVDFVDSVSCNRIAPNFPLLYVSEFKTGLVNSHIRSKGEKTDFRNHPRTVASSYY